VNISDLKNKILFVTLLVGALIATMYFGLLDNMQTQIEANGRVVNYKTQKTLSHLIHFGTLPTRPSIGKVHISIQISDINTMKFVENINVYLSIKGPNQLEWTPPTKLYNPFRQYSHELNYTFDKTGIWEFAVYVDQPNSTNHSIFHVNVKKTPSTPIIFVAVFVFLVIIGTGLIITKFVRKYQATNRNHT